jgi:hypothetical protein
MIVDDAFATILESRGTKIDQNGEAASRLGANRVSLAWHERANAVQWT